MDCLAGDRVPFAAETCTSATEFQETSTGFSSCPALRMPSLNHCKCGPSMASTGLLSHLQQACCAAAVHTSIISDCLSTADLMVFVPAIGKSVTGILAAPHNFV